MRKIKNRDSNRDRDVEMKKHIFIATLALLIINAIDARPHQRYARSFMATRPAYQHMSTQQSLWHDIIYNKTGPVGGAFRVIGFAQNSIPMHKTSHYFLPPCTDRVFVAGDKTPEDVQCSRNIRAEWIGLSDEFRGSFTIKPKETQYGFSLEYNQNFKTLFDFDFLENYWLSIAIPMVAVHHSMNLQQSLLNAPEQNNSDAPRTIAQAFEQPSWCYAKIGGSTKSIRPAEIRINIGSCLISKDYFQFAYNTIFVAPTGNKQNARQIFQAIAGNNQHFAFGGAIFFQFPLNRCTDEYGICFFTNLESIFNIRNTQYRTMDLQGKPWSRYLLFNQKCGTPNNGLAGAQHIPGVNILTHKVLVRPYGVFDFSMGWRYITDTVEAEFGYNIWGKSNEKVELKRPWFHPCEYEGIFGIAGDGYNTTASNSTITQQAPNDDEFTAITIFDLDPQSAESGSALNHKVHLSLGTRRDYCTSTLFTSLGGFIDIPQKNAALRAWGAWITLGASF